MVNTDGKTGNGGYNVGTILGGLAFLILAAIFWWYVICLPTGGSISAELPDAEVPLAAADADADADADATDDADADADATADADAAAAKAKEDAAAAAKKAEDDAAAAAKKAEDDAAAAAKKAEADAAAAAKAAADAAAANTSSGDVPDTYTVKEGDTLGNIAAQFGLNYEDIARINNIANVDLIYPGQELKLK
ncbi:MAG: LysM peptidoglycan-binding domain-containing protein [Coriobacteriia bacterium]|jgi:LysM repeat protein|nr:LysM peptidoglycan-binding domain-containing protein [Coriobacteriia bacterium]